MQPSEKQGNSNHAEPPAGTCSSSKREKLRCLFKLELAPQSSVAPEKEVDGPYYRPLLQAAFKGDWEFAKSFFEQDSASKTAKITSRSETVLHIAALSAKDQFLVNLVELLSPYPEALVVVDCDGRTALHNAVLCGRIRMVKALVRSYPKLTQLADNEGRVPLGISALEASMHKEIAWFLAEYTTDGGPSRPFSSDSAIGIIIDLTYAGHHDITLYLLGRYPHLKTKKSIKHGNYSILNVLAVMSSHFLSGTRLSVLEALIYKCIPVDLNHKPTNKNSDPGSFWNAAKILVPIIKRVHEVKLRHEAAVELAKQECSAISYMNTTEIIDFFRKGDDLLFQAIAKGTSELVKLCIRYFPELIQISSDDERLATHAVHFRKERTLRLFLKVSSTNQLSLVPGPTQTESTGLMRAVSEYDAARYYPSSDGVTDVAGAAFLMQRELQWYKAMESWIVPDERTRKIVSTGKLYWITFVENHKNLLESGEKWMKDTADKCMLVSTLIATVLFAAAFTVPGGNNDKTGVPLLLGQDAVLVFAISDTLGLFSSVTAILLFLAILTSRYEAQDFLDSLPKKIIMGLGLLFLSLAFMLVAFTATFKILLDKRLEWVIIPITLLASIPMALFAILQLPLLFQMVKSTYDQASFVLRAFGSET